jgi:excisionase family DNA binding protein
MNSSPLTSKPIGQKLFEVSAMNLHEAARRVSCSRRFLEKQIAIGRLKSIRITNRCVRIRPEDLAEFLEKNAV